MRTHGVGRLAKALDARAARLAKAARAAAFEAAEAIGSDAAGRCPEDSGQLARSIVAARRAAGPSRVAAAVECKGDPDHPGKAAAVEFGTAYMPAEPFMRPAAREGAGDFAARARAAARDALG